MVHAIPGGKDFRLRCPFQGIERKGEAVQKSLISALLTKIMTNPGCHGIAKIPAAS